MPEILGLYGLIPSVKSFCNKIDRTNKTRIHIITDHFNEEERFDNKKELALYRAIKELVNNTMKHARAADITIRFYKTDEFHAIEYTDNGIGFRFDEKIKGGATLGLKNIINRIESVNGYVHFTSTPGSGTKVVIRW